MDSELVYGSLVMVAIAGISFATFGIFPDERRGLFVYLGSVALLLWVAVAFSQNIALMWLGSIAYCVFSLSYMLRRTVMSRTWSGHAETVIGVVWSATGVVCLTAFADLVILVVLALVETVIPYYMTFL